MAVGLMQMGSDWIEPAKILGGLLAGAGVWWKLITPGWTKTMARLKKNRERKQRTRALLESLDKDMAFIKAQVIPNGGSSMRDALIRIEKNQQNEMVQREVLHEKIEGMMELQTATIGLTDRMVLLLDQFGLCSFANKAFQDYAGVTSADLEGKEWLNIVAQEDREMVKEQLETCIHDQRNLRVECRIRTESEENKNVKLDGSLGRHSGYFVQIKPLS